jgi:hypothetical protein
LGSASICVLVLLGLGEGCTVGVGDGFVTGIKTPLFQINFFPDLTQVNFLPA